MPGGGDCDSNYITVGPECGRDYRERSSEVISLLICYSGSDCGIEQPEECSFHFDSMFVLYDYSVINYIFLKVNKLSMYV
jgi:hypothetical protein